MSLCKHLTSLKYLHFEYCFTDEQETCLKKNEQETALQLLTSLQQLRFDGCDYFLDLAVGQHSLPSLKRILELPERGLPPSLEELEARRCCRELTEQCRMLATRKLNVKIDGKYVN
jgi:hypothetical protein